MAWSWSAEAATTHMPWAAHLHIGVYVRMRRSAGLCAHELFLSFPQFSNTTPMQCTRTGSLRLRGGRGTSSLGGAGETFRSKQEILQELETLRERRDAGAISQEV